MPNRSFHFVPAHRQTLLEKTSSLVADHIIYDLEDGVPNGDKKDARRLLGAHLGGSARDQTWVRCNSATSRFFAEDMAFLRQLPKTGIVLPKFEDVSLIDEINTRYGLTGRRLIVIVETFSAVQLLPQIAANKSVFGIAIGLEDLFSEFVVPNRQLSEIAKHVRLKVLIASRANGPICIDAISTEYQDLEQLEGECKEIRDLGFDGKFTIHPRQIAVVNRLFSVSEESLTWARRILKKSERHKGVGYTIIDGELITPPKVAKATKIVKAVEKPNG